MRTLVNRFLLAVLTATPVGCAATSDVGRAIVTERNGLPCFATSDSSGLMRLQAVAVYDESTVPPTTVWGVGMDPSQHVESSAGCVSYGQEFRGQKIYDPAAALQVGRAYGVFLNVRRANPRDPRSGDVAQFCLVAQPGNAKPVIRQVYWDNAQGKWPYEEVCGIRK
jgi:hypothetical protein